MGKKARQKHGRRGPAVGPRRGYSRRNRPLPWKQWGAWSVGIVAVLALGYAAVAYSGSRTTEDPEITALARENAGGPISVYTGSHHTVYHSSRPLPSASSPASDGKPTLVWFSGTWCEFCEQMEPFAHRVASGFRDRLTFVEKSVDHDRSAAGRYGIRGTPTFVLIDTQGRELTRFGFVRGEADFAARIEAALTAAGF
ncbi:MAG: hypothetical protein Kow0010_26720 [Dehalococcoidia bacterium]